MQHRKLEGNTSGEVAVTNRQMKIQNNLNETALAVAGIVSDINESGSLRYSSKLQYFSCFSKLCSSFLAAALRVAVAAIATATETLG